MQQWDGGVCGGGGQAHGCFFEVFTENRLKQEKAQRGKFRKSVMLHYRMACSPPHNEGHVGSVIYLCSWNLFIHSTFLFGFTEKHWSTISCSSSNVQRGGGIQARKDRPVVCFLRSLIWITNLLLCEVTSQWRLWLAAAEKLACLCSGVTDKAETLGGVPALTKPRPTSFKVPVWCALTWTHCTASIEM